MSEYRVVRADGTFPIEGYRTPAEAWFTAHELTIKNPEHGPYRAEEAGWHPAPEPTPEYRIALRPNSAGNLDDVVVNDVEMFRMEDMGDWWWLCCYLRGTDERICWSIPHNGKHRGIATTTEWPEGVVYEPGSMTP